MNNPFPNKKYQVVLADPPWHYNDKAAAGKRGAGFKYAIPGDDWLKQLPVKDILADDCVLFLWVTMPKLPECFALMEAWGFTFKTVAFTWVKRNKKADTWFFGMGNWTRCLSGDTSVYLKNEHGRVWIGDMASIGDHDPGSVMIWTHCGWRRILEWVKNGKTKVNRICVKGGDVLCSDEHIWPYKVPISRRSKDWKKGDQSRRIEHLVEEGAFEDIANDCKKTLVSKNGHSVNMLCPVLPVESDKWISGIDGFEFTDELGWLIGLFVAEGSFGRGTSKNQIRFSLHGNEGSISGRIRAYVDSLELYGDRYFNKRVRSYDFVSGSKRETYFSKGSVKRLIEKFVKGEGSGGKRLNIDLLLQTKASFRRSLIRGVLEGDGHNEENDCWKLFLCNKGLILDIKKIAESVCMNVTYHESKPQLKGKTLCYKYGLRFLTMHSGRVFRVAGGDAGLLTIESLDRHVCEVDTFDIEVEGGYFVANNMVTHNSNAELCLLGIKGKPKRVSASVHSVVDARIRAHSHKPDEVRERIVQLMGDVPRIELFARQKVNGWDCWGDEIEGDTGS